MNQYDQPTDLERSNPKQMWLDQVNGKRNFEDCVFLSFLTDLNPTEPWQSLFVNLPNSAGFVERLETFFELQESGLDNEKGSSFTYFHPLQRNEKPKEELMLYVKNHVRELQRIAVLAEESQLAELLSNVTIKWGGEQIDLTSLQRNYELISWAIYERLGDYFIEQRGRGNTLSCLSEACYSLAADNDLKHYLMSDFYNFHFDFENYFKLWVHGGDFAFDTDGVCIVTSVKRR